MFTLAHLSDPHLGSMPNPGIRALMSKRVLGYMSWRYRRRAIHEGPVLGALVGDLVAAAPDHVAVTGDVTNISLVEEFTRAREWLGTLGRPDAVSVIPGNHDAYVGVPWELSLGKWVDFMTGSPPAPPGSGEAPVRGMGDFPYLRRRGPVAIVGLSTAAPMPLNSAAGRLGERQLAALDQILQGLRGEGLFRVVLIHHPPLPDGVHPRKQLLDWEGFRTVIARRGAELILHGHMHRSGLAKLQTPAGTVPVIGVPSASARAHNGLNHSRYHLYRIERRPEGWNIGVEVRGVTPELDKFVLEEKTDIPVPDEAAAPLRQPAE